MKVIFSLASGRPSHSFAFLIIEISEKSKTFVIRGEMHVKFGVSGGRIFDATGTFEAEGGGAVRGFCPRGTKVHLPEGLK